MVKRVWGEISLRQDVVASNMSQERDEEWWLRKKTILTGRMERGRFEPQSPTLRFDVIAAGDPPPLVVRSEQCDSRVKETELCY